MNNIQSIPNFSRATGTRIDCIISEIMQIRKDWPVEPDISRNFIDWDHSALTEIRTALVEAARGSFSGEAGEKGLEDHLFRRLEWDRAQVIPWLYGAFRLAGARVLEIGCGWGSSTTALAEQGTRLTAIDVVEYQLKVVEIRNRAMGLTNVDLRAMNAADIGDNFEKESFDAVVLFACLEHMTVPERLKSLAGSWDLIPKGGHIVITDTPNRLWYFDDHTSFLPFWHWLPDEMASEYMQRFSPRKDLAASIGLATDRMISLHRTGRGASFHEIELAIAPVNQLQILAGKDEFLRGRHAAYMEYWTASDARAYSELMGRMYPGVPAPFFERSLEIIIRK